MLHSSLNLKAMKRTIHGSESRPRFPPLHVFMPHARLGPLGCASCPIATSATHTDGHRVCVHSPRRPQDLAYGSPFFLLPPSSACPPAPSLSSSTLLASLSFARSPTLHQDLDRGPEAQQGRQRAVCIRWG